MLWHINDKWTDDEGLSNGKPILRQIFDRWKGNIPDMFGVVIECKLKGGYR
ncbi:MAG: hypothetical protein ACI350_03870 [Prevotella sp.]